MPLTKNQDKMIAEFEIMLDNFAYYSDDNSGTDPIKASEIREELKSFISQALTESFLAGKNEGYVNGMHENVEWVGDKKAYDCGYSTGRREVLGELEEKISKLRPDSCDCEGAKYECEHWGKHENIDATLSLISEMKK